MRLLNVTSFDIAEFRDDQRPKYVIASHRWVEGHEVTLQEFRSGQNTHKSGYKKIVQFAKYVKEQMRAVEWLWVDTCCINKDSAAELSEAINSMFEWYRSAELCVAFLSDVQTGDGIDRFEKSEWFTRGWTLQELLAPQTVVFVTNGWHTIGYKGGSPHSQYKAFSGIGLEKIIVRITGIPEQVLNDYEASHSLSVYDKLKWMDGRETTRPEDKSYALFGIIGVTLPAIYGEKYDGARQRLLAAISQRDNAAIQQAEQLRKIADWLSSTNPWADHELVRQLHEPQTGAWLLQHNQYLAWKSGLLRLLWVYGKAGCGKTILCSTVIEDIRTHCQSPNTGHAIFYFSFSDKDKQTYQNLVRSLIAQLGLKEPCLSLLRQAYENVKDRQPGIDELQKILLSSIALYDQVFLHLDALDECTNIDGNQQNLLDGIADIFEQAPNMHILVTSRDVPDVRCFMQRLEAGLLSVAAAAGTVDADIQKYVSTQLLRNRKLSRLDSNTKTLIEETLVRRADGMFRWVHCQLVELTRSKNTRQKSVEAALLALPKDLDATYERMLNSISEDDRPYAITLIRWLAYARSPLSLAELAEASIIDPNDDSDGSVDEDNRGHWEDTLDILAGLIITENADEDNIDDHNGMLVVPDNSSGDLMQYRQGTRENTKVKLAHFSVKEYLESSRALASVANAFYLNPAREHRFLAQSCLVYLLHYSNSSRETSTGKDLTLFPLLEYTAKTWSYHASLQQRGSIKRELSLLTSEVSERYWLLVHGPHDFFPNLIRMHIGHNELWGRVIRTGLYYASFLGLETAVRDMLNAGAAVNDKGGYYGNALAAASFRGDKKIVQMLLNAGAWVDAKGEHGTALHAAVRGGHTDVMQMLIHANADINIGGGCCDTALELAAQLGHESVLQMLIDAGAHLEAQSNVGYGSALHAATRWGHESIVRILIDAGVNVNAQPFDRAGALEVASLQGYERVLQMLIDAGADVNAQGGEYGNPLREASARGHERVVQMLIDAGADVNAQGEFYDNPLQEALARGHEKVVQMLIDAGADVNA